jgi:hypothetical protein
MPSSRFTQAFAFFLPACCHAAVIFSVDLESSTAGDPAAGFSPYVLSDNTLSVPPYSVDVNPSAGAALSEFHRTSPLTTPTLTLGAVYRDGISVAADNTASFYRVGIDTVISGLIPRKKYTVTAWSYDSTLTGTRTSDWSLLGLGGPQYGINNYTFDGAATPATDAASRFVVSGYADNSGRLILRGRPANPVTTPHVILNGFTVDESADAPPAAPSVVLALDFNARTAPGATTTQLGFTECLLNGSGAQTTVTRTFGSQTVTLTAVGGTIDDRNRAAPTNSGAFTEALIARDFIFAATGGLDCQIQGLTAGSAYLVELWSFDNLSHTTVRTSQWRVNGGSLWEDYAFNGNVLPATNDDYKMAGIFTANGAGELLITGRVVANSPAVFLNALRVSLVGTAPVVDFGHPILSEFLADNDGGISDEDGDESDWIEIWNTTSGDLNLGGWRLTDNAGLPARWVFPAGVTLPSQQRLLVWASGKNRTAVPGPLHTNFALSQNVGSYLALSRPDGTIVSSFTNLPSQRADISYGVSGETEPLTAGFYAVPTPNSPNGTQVPGFVADTTFDITRGYFTAPFNVHITTTTPGATIYFTKDGSEPTTSSTPYPGAAGIPITTTTVLRAKAFAPPLAPTNTDTQTYLFNAQVQNQPASPVGWPSAWGVDSEVNNNDGAGTGIVPADYEMDPAVVGSTLPGYGVTDALGALPVLSVAMDPAGFHSAGTGIYANPLSRGDTWERLCSIEFIEQDGSGVHTNCGIRIHGNSSRRPFRMQKHSFRLAFRGEYGDGKLDYKLFGETTVKEFDRLVLHAFFTDGWGLVSWDVNRYRPQTALGLRDSFMKESFADMGHARVSGRYAHLYVNGLYWGIYKVGERVDETWCADHFGSLPEDWDVIAPGEPDYVRSGTATAWDSLFTFVNSADFTQPANYNNVAGQVDLANFADYYLLHVHGDAEDWPHHNGYAVRNRVVPGSKWKMVTWDQEISFDPQVLVDRLTPSGNNIFPKTWGELLLRLHNSPEFRLLFADRAHKHLNNGGALSLAVEQTRWQSLAALLDKAIVAESARWGDTADATPYGTSIPAGTVLKRETHWLPQVNLVKNSHFPGLHNTANNYATITELRARGLYPTTEPPQFSQFGGNVPSGFNLAITAPAGSIYYTLNGTDPREAFTGNPVGTLYAGTVALNQTLTVKARARNGAVWSALTEATFIVGVAASAANLAVTELNYHPALSEDHEFIELTNFSATTIDLTGVYFEGITFEFPQGTLLSAGGRIVVVRNEAAFVALYGDDPRIGGQFSGGLDNNGEEIAVIAANDLDIVRFRYEDDAPWPEAADGPGRTMVLSRPGDNPVHATNWRSSTTNGGNPGGSDRVAFSGNPLADEDIDATVALLEYALGSSDTVANDTQRPSAMIETFDIGAGPQPFLTITTRVAPAADDAALDAQFGTNLTVWGPAFFLGETINGGVITRKWRSPVPAGPTPQYLRLKATAQ